MSLLRLYNGGEGTKRKIEIIVCISSTVVDYYYPWHFILNRGQLFHRLPFTVFSSESHQNTLLNIFLYFIKREYVFSFLLSNFL